MTRSLGPNFHVWHTEHPGYGFVCRSLVDTGLPQPANYRICGTRTNTIEHVGGNDMQLPVCADHKHEAREPTS